MDLRGSRSFVVGLLLFALGFTLAQAQYVIPANFTGAEVTKNHVTMAVIVNDNNSQNFALEPLTAVAGRRENSTDNSTSALKTITGSLQLTTPDSYYDLQKDNIPYVSCDQSSYPGLFDVDRMLDTVAGAHPQAIVLYSKSASGCSLAPKSGFSFSMLYSMTDSNEARLIQMGLLGRQVLDAQIGSGNSNISSQGNSSDSSNNSSSGNGNGTPTTAVAMIILYSVTGVITAMFLLIIITGAVRAHRHPERYGPRNVLGRQRQSRARGIARAMLDTIPIVKFGENRDESKPADQDIEMANAGTRPENGATVSENSDGLAHPQTGVSGPQTKDGTAATTVIESSSSRDLDTDEQVHPASSAHEHDGNTPTGNGNDEGLMCSICTDEFVKGQDIRVLPCNHKFHPECVDPWLLNVSGTCPLCRIDLRPTASHTSESNHQESDGHGHGHGLDNLPPPLAADGEATAGTIGNRSSRRFSAYLLQTLGPRRMQDATAEERIAVLRRFRDHSATARNGHADGEQDHSTRQRLNARFRDTFRIRTRRRESMFVGNADSEHGPTVASASNNDQVSSEAAANPSSRT